MNQKVFDNARNGFYRDTVKKFLWEAVIIILILKFAA